jgi:hypothetical protein
MTILGQWAMLWEEFSGIVYNGKKIVPLAVARAPAYVNAFNQDLPMLLLILGIQ